MRFADPVDDGERLADEVRRHLESGTFWLEPAAYCTGLVSEVLEVLRHPTALRLDLGQRPGGHRHYVGAGRTPEGHLLQVGFHFERGGSPAGFPARAGFGSRMLVDSAWCETESAERTAAAARRRTALFRSLRGGDGNRYAPAPT